MEELAPKVDAALEPKAKKRNWIYFLLGFVIAVIAILGVVGWYMYVNGKGASPTKTKSVSPSPAISGLSTYRNSDYGFSFDYPKGLDSKGVFKVFVVGPTSCSEKGDEVCLYFVPTGTDASFAAASSNRVCDASLNKVVMMGGDTLDYKGAGRDTSFFDLTGFKVDSGKVAVRVQNNPYGPFEVLASNPRMDSLATNKNGVTFLAVKHSDEFEPGTFLEPGSGNKGNYVNLTGNTLPALGIIWLGGNSFISEVEFQGILDSFKITAPSK